MQLKSAEGKADIPALTGLRFFAAFFVLLSHGLPKVIPIHNGLSIAKTMLYAIATLGMMLFFTLSGFVIHYNYSQSIRNNPMLGIYNFLVARFARLYPLFFLGLLYDVVHHYGYQTLTPAFKHIMFYYLTLTHSWFYLPLDNKSLIFQLGLIPQVTWSISTEWFFYLFYPFICFLILKIFKRVRFQLLAIMILTLIAYTVLFLYTFHGHFINQAAIKIYGTIADAQDGFAPESFGFWLTYFSPYSRIGEFFVGCLTAAIYLRLTHIKPTTFESYIGIIMMIVSLAAILCLHFLSYGYFKKNILHAYASTLTTTFGYAPFLAIIIFCSARYNTFFSHMLSKPAIIVGGEASYSIYLFHLVIFEAFSRDAAPVTSWKVFFADFARFSFAFAAIVGMAILSYRIFETPARRYIRRMLTIKKPIEHPVLEPAG